MLTKKQKDLLMFIYDRIRETGVSPSFDEMKDALSLKSKSGIHRLITALEERGFIERLPHRARALQVLRLPESVAPPPGSASDPRAPGGTAIKTFREKRAELNEKLSSTMLEVPVMGWIAAGTPVSAIENYSHMIQIAPDLAGNGDLFALEVRGDSMINAGILNGDMAIIRRCETAENGAIIVALVDNEEATLKRLRRKGKSIALEAENPEFETRIYGQERVRIQGRLTALLRQY